MCCSESGWSNLWSIVNTTASCKAPQDTQPPGCEIAAGLHSAQSSRCATTMLLNSSEHQGFLFLSFPFHFLVSCLRYFFFSSTDLTMLIFLCLAGLKKSLYRPDRPWTHEDPAASASHSVTINVICFYIWLSFLKHIFPWDRKERCKRNHISRVMVIHFILLSN